jgi:hypothetical protein
MSQNSCISLQMTTCTKTWDKYAVNDELHIHVQNFQYVVNNYIFIQLKCSLLSPLHDKQNLPKPLSYEPQQMI